VYEDKLIDIDIQKLYGVLIWKEEVEIIFKEPYSTGLFHFEGCEDINSFNPFSDIALPMGFEYKNNDFKTHISQTKISVSLVLRHNCIILNIIVDLFQHLYYCLVKNFNFKT